MKIGLFQSCGHSYSHLDQANLQTESKIHVTMGWGERRMGSYCLIGKEFQFWMIKMF